MGEEGNEGEGKKGNENDGEEKKTDKGRKVGGESCRR